MHALERQDTHAFSTIDGAPIGRRAQGQVIALNFVETDLILTYTPGVPGDLDVVHYLRAVRAIGTSVSQHRSE